MRRRAPHFSLLSLLLAALACALPAASAEPDPAREFYRGIYTVCVYEMTERQGYAPAWVLPVCRDVVAEARAAELHLLAPAGWED